MLGSPWALPSRASAQTSEPATIHALPLTEAIQVDGWLREAAWSEAIHISNFNQRDLDFGQPASERTEVAVLFDADRNGYLFVTNPNGAIADALIAENGGSINKDWDGIWVRFASWTCGLRPSAEWSGRKGKTGAAWAISGWISSISPRPRGV